MRRRVLTSSEGFLQKVQSAVLGFCRGCINLCMGRTRLNIILISFFDDLELRMIIEGQLKNCPKVSHWCGPFFSGL